MKVTKIVYNRKTGAVESKRTSKFNGDLNATVSNWLYANTVGHGVVPGETTKVNGNESAEVVTHYWRVTWTVAE